MKTLKFKCTLLSDVILNQKSATEGPNQTLDFIPGSCFLGIVASEYDKFEKEENAMEIFHSGKVRFGDAHPSKGNVRGLKIPASMFHPKLEKASKELYIHHIVPNLDSDDMKKKQLKQCRNGFYIFAGDKATEVKTETNFAIKSAYDREKRRSKDKQMYGYESLQKGLELYFEVQVENDDLAKDIKGALVGKKRVGRSRTAQYGLVEITPFEYSEIASGESQNNVVTVYADGRLIFLDEYGLPTFQPSAEQLGLPKDAKILWDKSQIRTFQYAPWNYKRQCFDADRCGIEKGSVFVVNVSNCGNLDLKSQYVGSFNNEGFGKVIYNPEFLKAEKDGRAFYRVDDKVEDSSKPEKKTLSGSSLLNYIQKQQSEENKDNCIYSNVNKWVNDNKTAFQGKEKLKFASQWGAIRGIAMATKDDSNIKKNVITYIGHGVKSSDWDGNRRKKLEEFMNENEKNIREALVNLAAEMAKNVERRIENE
ncbi:MAG: hypothetical protein IK131_00255 [Paludibacteraceae bacterium]|nr:hypothetical protein [Paludibacteraceae bacterium]